MTDGVGFFFSSRRRHTRYWRDWSSDVCSSDLQIASVAYGALLGVFLLGVLTRRANQRGAMVGMLFGFGVELYLWGTHVPWTWWVMIGTVVTFGVGLATSRLLRRAARCCPARTGAD